MKRDLAGTIWHCCFLKGEELKSVQQPIGGSSLQLSSLMFKEVVQIKATCTIIWFDFIIVLLIVVVVVVFILMKGNAFMYGFVMILLSPRGRLLHAVALWACFWDKILNCFPVCPEVCLSSWHRSPPTPRLELLSLSHLYSHLSLILHPSAFLFFRQTGDRFEVRGGFTPCALLYGIRGHNRHYEM